MRQSLRFAVKKSGVVATLHQQAAGVTSHLEEDRRRWSWSPNRKHSGLISYNGVDVNPDQMSAFVVDTIGRADGVQVEDNDQRVPAIESATFERGHNGIVFEKSTLSSNRMVCTVLVGRCGVVGSTLAFGSIGHGFESGHGLFSQHCASAFSKLRSLAKCSLDDSVRRLL